MASAVDPAVEKYRLRFKKARQDDAKSGNGELEGSNESKRIYRAVDVDEMVEVAWHELPLEDSASSAAGLTDAPIIDHENLLKVVAKWEEPGTPSHLVVITEMVDAGTLLLQIERIRHEVRVGVVKKWCRQILAALAYLHDQGLRHGNVRLSNIFMHSTGDVRLGYLDGSQRGSVGATATHTGAAAYIAPEGAVSPASDVYSFGVCLLHMVTGETPYWIEKGEMAPQTLKAKEEGKDPLNLTRYRIDVSAETMIRDCIAQDPASRPTAAELLGSDWLVKPVPTTPAPDAPAPAPAAGGSASASSSGQAQSAGAEVPRAGQRSGAASEGAPDGTEGATGAAADDDAAASVDGTATHTGRLDGAPQDAEQGPEMPTGPAGVVASGPGAGAPPPIAMVGPSTGDAVSPTGTARTASAGAARTVTAPVHPAGDTASLAGHAGSVATGPQASPVAGAAPAIDTRKAGAAAADSTAPPAEPRRTLTSVGGQAVQSSATQGGAAGRTASPRPAPGPDRSVARLKGMALEVLGLSKSKVGANVTAAFECPEAGDGSVKVCPLRFEIARGSGDGVGTVAREMVDWRLLHPDDETFAAALLHRFVGHHLALPFILTRASVHGRRAGDGVAKHGRRRPARGPMPLTGSSADPQAAGPAPSLDAAPPRPHQSTPAATPTSSTGRAGALQPGPSAGSLPAPDAPLTGREAHREADGASAPSIDSTGPERQGVPEDDPA